jgi:Bacterial antitoxin of type II TA system, VapB
LELTVDADSVACLWHHSGMPRSRVSTTVDDALLQRARSLRSGVTDAALLDEALAALVARHRAAELDELYAAYDVHPAEEPDEWGDLASFRSVAASS